ncbi:MAG: proline iminopeptidase [Roseivirga sp.]|jgi:proline iminopeptidase
MKRYFFISLMALTAMACQYKVSIEENTSGMVPINGTELFYKTMGKGEPLVIVHGGPVLDHSYFLPHFEALAEQYQLVFYDQRASGRSLASVDSASMKIDVFIDDIEGIRKALNVDKINLFGHSWGGLLAMRYASKYSKNIDKLILSNSIPPSVSDWQAEGQAVGQRATASDIKERQAIIQAGGLQLEDPSEAIEKLLRISFRPLMADTANLKYLRLYVPKDYLARSKTFSLLGPELMDFNLYPNLAKLTFPTMVIYGNREPAVYLHAVKMAETFSNGELAVIDGAGHYPFVENPTDFNKAILDFLNKK